MLRCIVDRFISIRGIESFDPQLSSQFKILEFLTANLQAPSMHIRVHGTHTEHYTTRDSKGHIHHHTRTVTDFDYKIPITHYINKIGTMLSPHAPVDQYVASDSSLKQLQM